MVTEKGVMGCFPPEAFPGSVIQGVHDVLYVFLVDLAKIGLLREVRANQAVGVFVQAALPRVLRMRKAPLGGPWLTDRFVPSQCLAVVVGERMHPVFEGSQGGGDGL